MSKMLIRTLIIVGILSIFQGKCDAQKDLPCEAIQEVMESKSFSESFSFCQDTNIILVDTANKIEDCRNLNIQGRAVIVSHSWSSKFNTVTQRNQKDMLWLRSNALNKVVIKIQLTKHGKYLLYFYHPYSNSDILYQVQKEGNSYSFNILHNGAF